MSKLVVLVLAPFAVASTAGFAICAVVHFAALTGGHLYFRSSPDWAPLISWYLPLGTFVVFVPTICAAMFLSLDVPRNEAFAALMRGCPTWLRWIVIGLFVYAAISIVGTAYRPLDQRQTGQMSNQAAKHIGALSGFFMSFYASCGATMYSAIQVARKE